MTFFSKTNKVNVTNFLISFAFLNAFKVRRQQYDKNWLSYSGTFAEKNVYIQMHAKKKKEF